MTLMEEVRGSICSGYDIEEVGDGEYLIHTDMYYDDGDEFHIVLSVDDDGCTLTDEGHTMMWLSYDNYNFTETRRRLLEGILGQNDVHLDGGRLTKAARSPSEVGAALSSMVQAIMQVSNLRYLTKSNVTNTFLEDIRSAFIDSSIKGICEFGRKIPVAGGNVIEPDVYISVDDPVLVFGAYNSERAKEVFINLLLTKDLVRRYRTVVVIDSDSDISQKDRDRLINSANRPIMGSDDVVKMTREFIGAC